MSVDKKISSLGYKLTLGVTVPIFLTVILGPIGFVPGVIMAICVFAGK